MSAAPASLVSRRRILAGALAAACCGARAAPGFRVTTWPVGRPTPPLSLSSPAGRRWNLSALRGKVVVLNFWAGWCEPCLAELPQLRALADRHAHDGDLVVLGVNYRQGAAAVARLENSLRIGFPVVLDRDGSAFEAWSAGVLPSSVFVDRAGAARFRIDGEADWSSAQVRALLQRLVAEK